jgi:hypothetical protein
MGGVGRPEIISPILPVNTSERSSSPAGIVNLLRLAYDLACFGGPGNLSSARRRARHRWECIPAGLRHPGPHPYLDRSPGR